MTSTPPTTTDVALAALAQQVASLDTNVAAMRVELREDRKTYVYRGEWEQRNQTVDRNFGAHGREIGELRAEFNSRRAPWWSTWAVVLSGGALLWSVFGPAIRGG